MYVYILKWKSYWILTKHRPVCIWSICACSPLRSTISAIFHRIQPFTFGYTAPSYLYSICVKNICNTVSHRQTRYASVRRRSSVNAIRNVLLDCPQEIANLKVLSWLRPIVRRNVVFFRTIHFCLLQHRNPGKYMQRISLEFELRSTIVHWFSRANLSGSTWFVILLQVGRVVEEYDFLSLENR